MLKTLTLSALVLISGSAFATGEIAGLDARVKNKTDVMVFGTAHLAGIKEDLSSGPLAPVLQRLEQYQPTAIAVESLRPQDIATMIAGQENYQDVLKTFVGEKLISLAQKEQDKLKVTTTEAIGKLNKLLAEPEPTDSQRVDIIRFAIAGFSRDTAALQWKYLGESTATDAIDPELRDYLNKTTSNNNEVNVIASALALKLKLNRLYPIDDHLDKDMYQGVVEKLMPSYETSKYAAELGNSDYIKKPETLKKQASQTGDWLPLFTWYNSNAYKAEVIDKEWSLFVDKDLDPAAGAARIALWEVRNLNMASNIMRVVADHVGERVVIVVGSNHKVFLEQYLSNMIGVNLVQFNDLALAKAK
ncbi:DUF5694 domain-containing protein [Shewanella sedimentimangrovi]|uniref:GumN family protein n=1 Tax=Shewanella sedimentimangrovi TaxID=2814293 RepID=A0ABX7R6B7_9GAMM|nr:DUF5694 domain-containing protein [Shewanella sedimentimangrovi]QSX38346.1 hypothetical protein JYB85_05855 [Shewanella sedimentimangrovi]